MINKHKKGLILLTILFVLLIPIIFFMTWEAQGVSKVNYNQTYTYENKRITPDPPSYFKILDGSHYVAIPQLSLEDDYNEAFVVEFIQGSYTRSQDVIILGGDVTSTRLWFDSYQNFEKGVYSKKRVKIPLNKISAPFEEGQLIKKHGLYYYKSKRLNTYLSIKKKYVSIRLKKAKLDLPTTEKEFIQRYHKKQGHQQE